MVCVVFLLLQVVGLFVLFFPFFTSHCFLSWNKLTSSLYKWDCKYKGALGGSRVQNSCCCEPCMSEQQRELPHKRSCRSLLLLVALGMLIPLQPWYALLLGRLTRL